MDFREKARRVVLDRIRAHGVQVKRMPPLVIRRPEVGLTITLTDLVNRLPSPAGLFFVQVGAFDGSTEDPLHHLVARHDWSGVLAEPQSEPFVRLQATYGDRPTLSLRNVAVADRDESRPFYSLGAGAPEWAQRLASFDRSVIMRHGDELLAPHLIETRVQCVTFASLLADVPCVDILQIDAEGYDAELVRLFDFHRWQPRIVQFEHKHLARDAHNMALQRLADHGYRVAVNTMDTLAFRP